MLISALKHMAITILLGYLLMLMGFWWGVAPGAAVASLLVPMGQRRFTLITGFVGGLLLWLVWSWLLYQDGGQLITERIAGLFGIGSALMLLIGPFIGGILGAVSALAGNLRIK